ncbi:PHP domain-containing protein [Methanobacterium aggregans]|uniref:PHP domain-containing protein n=1 Tax=Methanobacterium aggregans TaxID=1615586 RepID=UPI001AE69F8C|nr:PHP domain-containing protein [Methanobacterium aggregans]MBP2045701.1 putative metal-dependent phosphoesterase TrpH [Methanobacterium aggregans]
MKYDFHTHSKYSTDGRSEPESMVKSAIKKGLSGIAVTDHNTIKGGVEAKKYETTDFEVIVGSEIMTDRGEVIGLFLSEEIKSRSFSDVVNEIKDQNGFVVVPHPFDTIRGKSIFPKEEDARLIDNIEVFNSRCVFKGYNKKAKDFAGKSGVNIIAGSDAHFLREIGTGGVATESSDVYEAVLKGDFKVFGKRSPPINLGLSEILRFWKMMKE